MLRALRIIAVNLVVVLALVALIEWVSSFFASKLGAGFVHDVTMHHKWRPNYDAVHREWAAHNPDFPEPYTHHYNSQSWLEKYEVSREKPADTYRIFYVGDSFVQGPAPMDQSVPSVVERELNERSPGNLHIEVVNTGTGSYAATLYFLLIRHFLLDYDPDLFVINVDMTDFYDDWKYSRTIVLDDAGDPVAVLPRRVWEDGFEETPQGLEEVDRRYRMRLWLLQNSYTFNWLEDFRARTAGPRQVQKRMAKSPRMRRQAWCDPVWDEVTESHVERTLGLLQKSIDLARRNGVRLMLTSVPHYEQFAPPGRQESECSSRAHREIEALARKNEVPYMRAFEPLRSLIDGTEQSRYYYAGDMHFNPRGLAAWAQLHVAFLLDPRHQLLPPRFYAALGP